MEKTKELVQVIYDEVVAIRRDLHAHPELSEHEERTAEKISQYLTDWGIPHTKNVAGHGIVAILEGKKGIPENQKYKAVGIRADIDALPIHEATDVPYKSQNCGVMHACGHDIHTAVLLGTAKILKTLETDLNGTVKFFFQPSEETIGGANQMIEAGCLENPKTEAVLAFHVAPDLPCGTVEFRKGKMNAASCEFNIIVKGNSCHGAHPQLGCDPIVIASQIVVGLQSIVSRNLDPVNTGLITVGMFEAGSKGNIIPGEAKLTGIIRALDNDTRTFLKEKLKSFAENTARAFDGEAQVNFKDSYPALENDSEMTEIMESVAKKLLSEDMIKYMPAPSLGADDFSYFTQNAKGVYFNIGTLRKNETVPQALHNEYFNPDENCIKTGMLMEVAGVFEVLGKTI